MPSARALTALLPLFLVLAIPARAQDEEGGDGPPPLPEDEPSTGGGLMDVELGDFDLGPSKSLESTMSYEGQFSSSAPNYVAGTTVTITHSTGSISVRCTDQKGLTARLQYKLDGTNQDALKRYGDSIKLTSFASSSGATVKSSVPSRPSTISRSTVSLVVNLPLQASVSISGATDWVQVVGCKGSVKASTSKNGAFASGTLKSFDLSSGTANVEVELTDDAVITAASRASAPQGDVTLRMPLTQAATLTATADTVQVSHLVNGTNVTNKVQGQVNGGGPAITLSGKGTVLVTAPK